MKCLIVYGSRKGHTALVAQRIKEVLVESDWDVTLKDVKDASVDELKDYEVVLLGCSTYGDGDLWKDFIPFESALVEAQLPNLKAAAFGCGSARYPAFCWAADILENALKKTGCKLIQGALKMDTLTGLEVRQADTWTRWLLERV